MGSDTALDRYSDDGEFSSVWTAAPLVFGRDRGMESTGVGYRGTQEVKLPSFMLLPARAPAQSSSCSLEHLSRRRDVVQCSKQECRRGGGGSRSCAPPLRAHLLARSVILSSLSC